MRCVILQPSYLPWRGYFDLIHRADIFVFYDDVQYDKNGWRNRNRIKTPQGTKWLTIPVPQRGVISEKVPINAVMPIGSAWPQQHLETLKRSYAGAPCFDDDWLRQIYGRPTTLLADFTIGLTIAIAARLGIQGTRFDLPLPRVSTALSAFRSVRVRA
jgi:hypothetical protein